MIGFVCGTVLDRQENRVLIKASAEAYGVGYEVLVPLRGEYDFRIGQKVELFSYTHVREDILALYGFSSKLEKALFEALLRVKGVGPKMAISVLSGISPAELLDAILKKRKEVLNGVSGVGKKTAELMVLELNPLFTKWMDSGYLHGLSSGEIQSDGVGVLGLSEAKREKDLDFQAFVDAKGALLGLGFREGEVVSALKRLKEQQTDLSEKNTQELLKLALRELS